jgi:phosphopantetheine adenylyltransferase
MLQLEVDKLRGRARLVGEELEKAEDTHLRDLHEIHNRYRRAVDPPSPERATVPAETKKTAIVKELKELRKRYAAVVERDHAHFRLADPEPA